ncbi:MAG: hypothetical protein V3R29_01945 [Candidatus Acidoferrales bacterium]
MMKRFVYWIDGRVNLIIILLLFWALFWGLNGGDKFFNGQSGANVEQWSTRGVLVDAQGNITYTLHPMETIGLYGVNRDAKTINYFKGIHLPREVALVFLYGIATLEVFLGLTFLALFGWSLLPEDKKLRIELFSDRTIHRLAFKGSILIFAIFSIGDILFGDRAELWEHGTFIVLCLITYDMWYRTDQFLIQQRRVSYAQDPSIRSNQAASYQKS